MVHARVSEAYINFTLMYTTYHIFPVLPIKDLINKDSNTTMPFKIATGTKTPVSHLRVLYCPCVSWRATAHVGTKALNMYHQVQKGFCGIVVGIPQHQKGHLVYVPLTRKIISSYNVFFDESFYSVLGYMSQPYAEAMTMHPYVSNTSDTTYPREKIGDIILFTQFGEGIYQWKRRIV